MSTPPPPPPPPPGGPYGQQPYGQQPYGQQQYGYGSMMEHPQGTTILVLGILSLVVCGVLGPFAWSMGNKALREIDANPQVSYTNRGNVSAGRICGMISSILLIVGVAFIILVVIAGGIASNSG
ncbi:MAG: DUF4190 domain-containing protein [Ilumatobacteraceae bacterium]|jgi:uncharacterized BrkB/YihY/UPF0761 family membrane protein